jgi:hypothetical protein
MRRNLAGLIAAAAAIAIHAVSAGAAPLPVEAPIDRPNPDYAMEPGSYRLLPARAPDPDGGLPWGMATYLSNPGSAPRGVLCTVLGRVQDDQLGMVTTRETFVPIAPGGSPQLTCGGLTGRFGERAVTGYNFMALPARVGVRCDSSFEQPGCRLADLRTVFALSLGRGILGAWIQDRPGDRWEALTDGGEGTFLAVRRGLFTDKTMPTIRIRATLCGPDARTDLARERGHRSANCVVEVHYPNDPRPTDENAASRRARRAADLDLPVRVAERTGTASTRRFTARLKTPITVQTNSEGYAYRLTGPAGRRCNTRRTADTSKHWLTSYTMIAGKPLALPILPLNIRRGVWCRGTYTLTVLFVAPRHNPSGGRATIAAKPIASTTFRVR